MLNIKNRTIFCKDNLDVLQGINSESVDLIYLDPPFNKKKTFTAPIGSSAEGASFKDYFREEDIKDEWVETIKEDLIELYNFLNGVKSISNSKHYLYNYCYLCYMAIRLIEMRRILKDTGSIYFHCDPTMSHYVKIMMDTIFGEKNFRNEIIWQRNNKSRKGSQFDSKKYGANTDTILFYTKTDNFNFSMRNVVDISEKAILQKFNKKDDQEKLYHTGMPIFRSKGMGERPNLCYEWRGFKNPDPSGWRLSKERLEEEYQKGNIIIKENGKLERRKYLDNYNGEVLDNNWTDIPRVTGKESTGYPTQKPLKLLERIIKSSSKEGDVILDSFCGCATTCVASENLNRKWIGIDVSRKAYDLVKERLNKEVTSDLFTEKDITFHVDPPRRTDHNGEEIPKKYVYVISHPNYVGEYKVGIAKNYKSRLNSYQIGDPDRSYKIEFTFLTEEYRETEKHIHTKFNNKHEWVTGNLKDIIDEIENYKDKE